MTQKERLNKIDEAIDHILCNLKEGIEITRYTIGNTTIEKKTPIELVSELVKLKQTFKYNTIKTQIYRFGGGL